MSSLDPFVLYRDRGCSRQWRGFVQAMADEFAAELPAHELPTLMARIGLRFARLHPLQESVSLVEVEAGANRIWSEHDWGMCRLLERTESVEILHACAPINVALDADWSDGFLEGVYEGWFRQLGMLAGLAVRVVPPESADLRRFRLARAA